MTDTTSQAGISCWHPLSAATLLFSKEIFFLAAGRASIRIQNETITILVYSQVPTLNPSRRNPDVVFDRYLARCVFICMYYSLLHVDLDFLCRMEISAARPVVWTVRKVRRDAAPVGRYASPGNEGCGIS